VGFEIGFVDDVEAEFVAEIVEARGVRVMGAADGVDVGALHLQQVLAQVFLGDVVTGDRVMVVAVDALEEDRLAVVEKVAVLDPVAAESGATAVNGDRAAVGVAQREQVVVEFRRLGAPGFDVREIVGLEGEEMEQIPVEVRRGVGERLAIGVEQFELEFAGGVAVGEAADFRFDLQGAGFVVVG
jgi:hypothetical protein